MVSQAWVTYSGESLRSRAAHVRDRFDKGVHLLPRVRSPERNPDAALASVRLSPIAVSTCEGSTAPLEHAEPLETQKPLRSRAITIASPSIPRSTCCWYLAHAALPPVDLGTR